MSDQLLRRGNRDHVRAFINASVTEIPCHTFHHAIKHSLCLNACRTVSACRILFKRRFKLLYYCIWIKIWDLCQFLLYGPVTSQLVLLPCNIRISGDLLQSIQVIFTETGHIDHITFLITGEPQHFLTQPFKGMGIRRSVIVMGLIPVHGVERLKTVASICRRSYPFRIGCRVPDGNPVFPEILHILQIHCGKFFCSQFLIHRRHGRCPARGMFCLNRHRCLLLRSEFEECLRRQIIQHIASFKHLAVITVDLFF